MPVELSQAADQLVDISQPSRTDAEAFLQAIVHTMRRVDWASINSLFDVVPKSNTLSLLEQQQMVINVARLLDLTTQPLYPNSPINLQLNEGANTQLELFTVDYRNVSDKTDIFPPKERMVYIPYRLAKLWNILLTNHDKPLTALEIFKLLRGYDNEEISLTVTEKKAVQDYVSRQVRELQYFVRPLVGDRAVTNWLERTDGTSSRNKSATDNTFRFSTYCVQLPIVQHEVAKRVESPVKLGMGYRDFVRMIWGASQTLRSCLSDLRNQAERDRQQFLAGVARDNAVRDSLGAVLHAVVSENTDVISGWKLEKITKEVIAKVQTEFEQEKCTKDQMIDLLQILLHIKTGQPGSPFDNNAFVA